MTSAAVYRIQGDTRARLAAWRATVEGRDDLVRLAYAYGLSKYEIHQISGIARTTIDRILSRGDE